MCVFDTDRPNSDRRVRAQIDCFMESIGCDRRCGPPNAGAAADPNWLLNAPPVMAADEHVLYSERKVALFITRPPSDDDDGSSTGATGEPVRQGTGALYITDK